METIIPFEIIFFKVIHNKYLFNKIIQHLDTTNQQSIEYNDIEKWYVGNKKKFSDIKSLGWMIKNGQIELLKYKLQSNEYIHVNEKSFTRFIEYLSTNNSINIQLFQLFYEKCKIQIDKLYLIEPLVFEKVILKYSHLESLKILITNNQVSRSNGPFLLKCLNYCNLDCIKLLFSNAHTVTINLSTRDQALKYSSLNLKHKDQILEWWLLEMNGTKDTVEQMNKIQFYDFITIKSIKIQKLLLKKDLVKKYILPVCYFKKNVNNIFKMEIDELKLHLKILYKLVIKQQPLESLKQLIQSTNSSINQKKELQKLIIKATGYDDFLYFEYLKIYDEIIQLDNQEDSTGKINANKEYSILKYGFYSWSNIGFEYMVNHLNFGYDIPSGIEFDSIGIDSNEKFEKMVHLIILAIDKHVNLPQLPEMIQFIVKNCNSYALLDQLLIGGISLVYFKISNLSELKWSFEKYKWYYSNVNTEIPYNEEIGIQLINKESIDFIMDNVLKDCSTLSNNLEIYSIDLADYVFYEKCKSNGPIQQIYFNCFLNSIVNFDLETLNKFILKGYIFSTSSANNFNLSTLNQQQINQLIQFLNESGFNNFDDQLFINFLNGLMAVSQEYTIPSIISNNFTEPISQLCINYIMNYQLNHLERLLSINNGAIISSTSLSLTFTNDYIKKTFIKYIIYDSNKRPYKIDNISSKTIESIIKLLVNKFGNDISTIIYEHLYKILLQCKDINITILNSIRNLFKLNLITFEMEETYHLFYYLGIRSLKHLKFIMGKNEILEILEKHSTNNYDCNQPYYSMSSNEFNISDYLNNKYITFDNIFGSTTTTTSLTDKDLFYLLRNQFSILPIQKKQSINTPEKINWFKQDQDQQDFKYLLSIGDLDLIKSFLFSTFANLNYYFTIYVSNDFIKLIGSNIQYLQQLLDEFKQTTDKDISFFIKNLLISSFEQSNLPLIKFILSIYKFPVIPYSINQLLINNHLDITTYVKQNKLIVENILKNNK